MPNFGYFTIGTGTLIANSFVSLLPNFYGMNHIGLYVWNHTNKKEVIDQIFGNTLLQPHLNLKDLKGVLFSAITIDKLIDEEYRHDRFEVTTAANASLESMSSGQQRLALLQWLLNQKPNFIVLDDVHSCIDAQNLQKMLALLAQHSHHICFIQLLHRKTDVLPFIDTVFYYNENGSLSQQAYWNNEKTVQHNVVGITIPQFFEDAPPIDPVLDLRNITVGYNQKQVLYNVSWVVRKGELWQLKGPVGSGKTTLLSMIIGDNPKAYGQNMVLFGIKKGSGESIWDIKKHIGYFYPAMTLRFNHTDTTENMLISGLVDSLGLYIKPTEYQQHIAREWLKILGPDYRNTTFQKLSPGQQRILLVVRAIIKQPPLLILDEPTAGLDDENAQLFVHLINALANQQKMAIIYVSHRPEPGLNPQNILTLCPTPLGSVAEITRLD